MLTEPTFFDGALEHLERVRAAVPVPLLRKDFIVSRYQLLEAAAAGADAVLLIVAALDDRHAAAAARTRRQRWGWRCLVEVHDTTEIARAVDAGARVVGVNSRNLRTLAVDMRRARPRGVAAACRRRRPLPRAASRRPRMSTRLSAAGYHAFLVGERLITQPDPGDALRELRGHA